jgi:hypothetical protein
VFDEPSRYVNAADLTVDISLLAGDRQSYSVSCDYCVMVKLQKQRRQCDAVHNPHSNSWCTISPFTIMVSSSPSRSYGSAYFTIPSDTNATIGAAVICGSHCCIILEYLLKS